MKTDVSVEYAHIYTNDQIRKEHEVAIDELKTVTDKLDTAGESHNLVVLVDDYSFPDPSFDYEAYSKWLAEKGFAPDFMYRESQLIPLCDETLNLMKNEKSKQSLVKYVQNKKYPCSLFIASWYLLRLGVLGHPAFDKGVAANKLINILPESFRPYEDEALEIIKATDHREIVDRISYEFIEGRQI
ncbi:MAG TPA: hypothetical protein VLF21_03195 [Candidatus Saccharimonadales bacterium]|nr:hypothetical protein [Candidatus Saccharimonadales bacterium]